MPADVVCLSHLRWGFVHQRPNHLMVRCARERRVFFVEEPLLGAAETRITTREVHHNLWAVVPHVSHDRSGHAAAGAQRRALDLLARQFAVSRPVLWFYTPMALAFARHLDASAVVFDCMDELSAFLGAPADLPAFERELFRIADVVFTGGQSLYEAKRGRHPNVHALPSSVDAEHFARALAPGLPDPHDQHGIPHPRLGFFGVIDERMDQALLAALADARPDWHLVMIGPVAKIDPATLPRRPNIHYLGRKRYEELPAYLAGWDVATMPFACNEATRFISPTKTLEYLAAGRPVVSTPIHDVVRPYGEAGVVRVAEGPAFVRAIEAALAERGTPAAAARRRAAEAMVAGTSWDRTWERMRELIEQASRARRAARERERACSTS